MGFQLAQLVALLEFTLAAIKAPYIETKRTRSFFDWLKKVAKKAIEKGIEKRISDAIGDAVDTGYDMVGKLSEEAGTSDLTTII